MTKKLIALWFVLSLTLIAATEWMVYRNTVGLIARGEAVNRTLEIISSINELESHLLEAESARRGFVITGKLLHLSQYRGSTELVKNLMSRLQSLTRNEPEQQNRLESLRILIIKKLEHLDQSIRLRRQAGLHLEDQIALTDAGKALRDDIQQILVSMETSERQRFWQTYLESTRKAQRSFLDLALGTFFSFGILALVFGFLNREISARTKAETSLQRANRTLKTLSEANQALLRAPDEDGLLQEICRILVTAGGYRLAWVGRVAPHQEQAPQLLAFYGQDQGYLEAAAHSCAHEVSSRCPFIMAVQTASPCIIRNLGAEPELSPCQTVALKSGFAAVAAYPLKLGDQPWGVLGIYAGEPDAFDAEEVKLLEELARDLEFGVASFRTRLEHQRAERALKESEAQYRLLVDNLNHGLSILSPQGIVTFANPKLCELLGYSREEIIGHEVFDFFDQDNQEILRDQLDRRRRGEKAPYEITWTGKDGEKIIALITPMPLFDHEGHLQSFFAVITDITDRKQAEAWARDHLRSLNLLIAGVEKLAKIRDPDAMVQEICQQIVDAFDARLVWLGRVESQGCIRPLYGAGEMDDCLKDMEILLDNPILNQGPIAQAIKSGKPSLINDVSREAPGTPWVSAGLARGYQALGAFPLLSGDRAFACLNIYSARPNFFTPEQTGLLQAFAGIAAAAVENANLNAKVEKHLRHLQALRRIDMAISDSLDLRLTLNVLLDQLTAQLQVDAASILLLNPHSLVLEFAAGRGFKTDAISRARVPLGKGYAGIVALKRQPVYIPDLDAVPDKFARHPFFASENFVSYYGVPLINKAQVRGVIEVLHRSRFDADAELLDFLESLAGQAAIAIDNASLFDGIQRSHLELSLAYEATLEGWARALELRDFETKGHSQRVTELTLKLARALGVEDQELTHIYRGALLHDIGKIAIPDSILLKPGRLTPEERVIMRQHPFYAYELLSPITYLGPALDIPFCHHERWDGRGYPRGLKGEDIPLAARIFAVVDVWDALGSDRPYRRAWSPDKIRAYLHEQAGLQFDPQVVEVFVEKFLCQTDTAA
jgi:PAS domain S-box-containing protein